MVIGGLLLAWSVLGDTLLSFTREGRFGSITVPGLVYQASFLVGIGLAVGGYRLAAFGKRG